MTKRIQIVTIMLTCFLIPNSIVFSQEVTKVGTTAANFIAIDMGPRGTAMGSAYVSVANDVSAMYWNPAGIASIRSFQSMFANTKWILDLSLNYAGVVVNISDIGSIGISATFLTMDEMEKTTIMYPDGTGELFDAACSAVGLSYARYLTDRFAIGFTAKYIYERYYHSSARGLAFDIGALFETWLSGLKFGMCITNYGTKMKLDGRDLWFQTDPDPIVSGNNSNINSSFQTDSYHLPLLLRIGLSMDILKGLYKSNLILSVDALHPNDDVESVNVGGEYVFNNVLFLRAGWKDIFKNDTQQSVTFGGGLKYEISGFDVLFDFSYLYFHKLGDVKMFSIGLNM